MNIQLLTAFFLYFIVILSIGLISYKKQKTAKDFIIGNRSLTYLMTAFSAHASDMSAWLFMAFPATIYLFGFSHLWIAIGLLLGMFLNWQFVAEKLRISTEKYDSTTLSSFLEKRFQDNSGIIRVVTALMIVFFMTCYLAAALIAMGNMLNALFGINYYLGLTVAMIVAITYTTLGGYYTIARVDQFQALFLLAMIILVPTMAYLLTPGGATSIINAAEYKGASLTLINDTSFSGILSIIFLVLSWGLGYFGQPHIITKFMGIKTPSEVIKAKYVGMSWQFLALGAACLVGFIGIGFFENPLDNPELVFVEMVKNIFHPLVGGFILCGLIAANMSTMDSQILVSASALSEDFWKHLFKKHATQKELLLVSRIAVLFVGGISLGISFYQSSTVLDAVLYAWSGLGCAFGPAIIMALYDKRASRIGVITGILVGGIIAAIWPTLNPLLLNFPVPSMIPGFFLSIGTIFFLSRLIKK
jgi:sodium/proline symporter